MFMDWKNQCSETEYTTQSNLHYVLMSVSSFILFDSFGFSGFLPGGLPNPGTEPTSLMS